MIDFLYTQAVVVVGVVAAVFIGLFITQTVRRDAPTIPTLERGATLGMVGVVLLLVFFTLFFAGISWQLGGVCALLSAVYVLYSLPEATRRYEFRSVVTIRCTPADAFALVSDARNWPRYFPDMKVLEPLDVPPHLGSLIHVVVTQRVVSLSADERVTAYEPPRRFATALQESRVSGAYEFTPTAGGTEVVYTGRGVIGIRHALLGNAVLKSLAVRRMRARRETAMGAIKQILEAAPAVPV